MTPKPRRPRRRATHRGREMIRVSQAVFAWFPHVELDANTPYAKLALLIAAARHSALPQAAHSPRNHFLSQVLSFITNVVFVRF